MTEAKRKSLVWLFTAVLLLSGIMALAGVSPAFAAMPSGVDISTTTTTVYKMELPVNNMECYLHIPDRNDMSWPTLGSYDELIDGNYTTPRTGTVIVTFNDVKYETMPVMITGLCQIKYPSNTPADKIVEFHSDITVNIRESYYNYFTEKAEETDWSNVSFMFVLGNNAYGGGRTDSINNYRFTLDGIRLYSEDVTGDPNDPDDPNFDMGDNGGQNANPEPEPDISLLRRFYNWCTDTFGWDLSYGVFLTVFWIIVGVPLFAIAVRLLRLLFGK